MIMAGLHPKGTNDADGNGEKGGSKPEKRSDSERIDLIVEMLERNGMTLPKGLK
jgi:hypothetical protein